MPVGPDTGCLCQTAPTRFPPPVKCADEGGNCQCAGTVFFGKQTLDEGLYSAFEDFVTEPYAYKHNQNGNISCMADGFSYEYELDYNTSSCFCDATGFYKDDAIERDVNYFLAEYRKY
jgi:hypothetical protein